MEQSADIDLDSLLLELSVLENQLQNSTSRANNAKTSNLTASSSLASSTNGRNFTASNVRGDIYGNFLNFGGKIAEISANKSDELATPTNGQDITIVEQQAKTYGQRKIVQHSSNDDQKIVVDDHSKNCDRNSSHQDLSSNNRTQSPDNDSAFCDSGSLTSSESILSSNNGHNAKNVKFFERQNNTTSVDQKIKQHQNISNVRTDNLSDEERRAQLKAEKIKIALEKMREANVKKVCVKIFHETSSLDVLIDERWTVAYVVKHLAEKFSLIYSVNHALVEHCPDLHIERVYEDHEYLLENIQLWTKDSNNEIHLLDKPIKYDLFYNPQLYLLRDGTKNMQDAATKQRFITSSKDLVCLSQLDHIQVYIGIGWKKKYKAPTDYGFALKHPKIQMKASKYVKYLCVENEDALKLWMTALRLAKYGKQLFDNFAECCECLPDDPSATVAVSQTVLGGTIGTAITNAVVPPKSAPIARHRPQPPVETIPEETSSVASLPSSSSQRRPRSKISVDDNDDVSSTSSSCRGGDDFHGCGRRSVCSATKASFAVPYVDPRTVPYTKPPTTADRRDSTASIRRITRTVAVPYNSDVRAVPFDRSAYRTVHYNNDVSGDVTSNDDDEGDDNLPLSSCAGVDDDNDDGRRSAATATEEADSDEEGSASAASLPSGTVACQSTSSFFPPPPQDNLFPTGSTTTVPCRTASVPSRTASVPPADSATTAPLLSSFSHYAVPVTVTGMVVDSATVRRRKPPPAPPKRLDSTRLSAVSMTSSGYSLNNVENSNDGSLTDCVHPMDGLVLPCETAFEPPNSPLCGSQTNSVTCVSSVDLPTPTTAEPSRTVTVQLHKLALNPPTEPTVKKPPIPVKPKFFPAAIKNMQSVSSEDGAGAAKSPQGDFQSELQLAMQRRLQKLNSGADSTIGLP